MPLQTMSYWIALMPSSLSWSFGIEREEFVDRHVRHRERIVREVDLLLFLVPFVHREVDDPAELEAVLGDQIELVADLGARRTGELDEVLRLAGDEEHGIAVARGRADRRLLRCAPAPMILGERPRAALLAFAPEDVAEPRLALALRPGIHAVAERAVAAARRRDRPDLVPRLGLENAGEHLEAGAAEDVASRPASRSGCAGPACRCRSCGIASA